MKYPAVQRWLTERTSLEPSLLEGAGFESLVAERLAAIGGASESAYIVTLDGSADEVDRLTGGIAVPETWFFRYPQSFALLADFLEARLHAGETSLRMLSIGCATGEEPYSMAMTALHCGWRPEAVRIDAIDRSREVLRRAEAGSYGAFSIRAEVPAWSVAYLQRTGDKVTVEAGIRKMVNFLCGDAVDPAAVLAGAPYDVIFCRNLLIYLGEAARKRLLDSICRALAPSGRLFVGHAEPLLCSLPGLRSIASPHAFALERIEPSASESRPTRPLSNPKLPPAFARPRASTPAPPAAVSPGMPREAESPATLDDARALADAGRIAESEALVHAISARKGPSADAMELLGMLRMAAEDAAGARALFERAVYLEPRRATSLLQLALISERAGDPRRAELLWGRARRASEPVTREDPA